MKEKILKLVNFKLIKKITVWILLLFVSSFILVAIYSFTFEQDKIAIDRYNFGQLEKVKLVLKNVPEKEMEFYSLKTFNELYKTNITTIKNCYYLDDDNWNKPYIFWFQLESMIYKFIHFWKNYAYPSYSIPIEQYCLWEHSNWAVWGCYDSDKQPFIDKISKPCE